MVTNLARRYPVYRTDVVLITIELVDHVLPAR